MEILEQLLDIIRVYEKTIHETEFAQFTIDFIQNTEMRVSNELDEAQTSGDVPQSYVEDIVGAVTYEISTILDVIKEGKDKFLFEQLANKISIEILTF